MSLHSLTSLTSLTTLTTLLSHLSHLSHISFTSLSHLSHLSHLSVDIFIRLLWFGQRESGDNLGATFILHILTMLSFNNYVMYELLNCHINERSNPNPN